MEHEGKEYIIKPELEIKLTSEDIDDIMCAALEGGITYWACKCDVIGDYLGEYAHEQISRGGMLKIYDSEIEDKYWLTLEKLLKGIKIWIESGYDINGVVSGNTIDVCQVDAVAADGIVQCAIFGDIVYG